MKLRLRPNSIRLRLRRADVHGLLETGRCDRTIVFTPGQRLQYSLQSAEVGDIRVTFVGDKLCVVVPKAQVHAWADGAAIGIESVQQTGGEPLAILIEKDFACVDGNSAESQEGAFPNPTGGCGRD